MHWIAYDALPAIWNGLLPASFRRCNWYDAVSNGNRFQWKFSSAGGCECVRIHYILVIRMEMRQSRSHDGTSDSDRGIGALGDARGACAAQGGARDHAV